MIRQSEGIWLTLSTLRFQNKMKTILMTLLLLPLLASAKQACGFESSDGKWSDFDYPSKGRTFVSVLYDFEIYKFKIGNPDIQLFRTTKPGFWADKDDPKWNVPYREPTNIKERFFDYGGFTESELKAFHRKAEAQLEHWKNSKPQSKESGQSKTTERNAEPLRSQNLSSRR